MGDLNESFGASITTSRTINELLETTKSTLSDVIGFLDEDDGRKAVEDFFDAMVEGAADALGFVGQLSLLMASVTKQLVSLLEAIKKADIDLSDSILPVRALIRVADNFEAPAPDDRNAFEAFGDALLILRQRIAQSLGRSREDFVGPPVSGAGSRGSGRRPRGRGPGGAGGGGRERLSLDAEAILREPSILDPTLSKGD